MTIDTKNLRVLAEDCMNREIDFDDVSPNQGSTSCDKLTRAYFRDANPAAILALLDALERKDRVLREALEAIEIAKNGLDWFKDSYPHDVNESDAEASEQINEAIEAITKELAP